MKLALMAVFAVAAMQAQTLDFEVYKTKVEPIFMKKRPGHARCVSCHSASNNAFRLQAIPRGQTGWTADQTKLNYENVSHLAVPGNPEKSKILLHPLAQTGGGDLFHSGGRQFLTKDDPDWKTIEAWVNGK